MVGTPEPSVRLPGPRPERRLGAVGRAVVWGADAERIASERGWVVAHDLAELEALAREAPPDAIAILDRLGSADDPAALLRRVRQLLPAEGKLLLTARNAQAWPVVRALIEGTFRPSPSGVLTSADRHLFTRNTLCDLVASTGFRLAAIDGTLVPEGPPPGLEDALLRADVRAARLPVEGNVHSFHLLATAPAPDAVPDVSWLDPSRETDDADGRVERVGVRPRDGEALGEALARGVERARARTLVLGAKDADLALALAERLDEWTDVVAGDGVVATRRAALFGVGGFEGSYDGATAFVEDFALRASLGGRSVRRLARAAGVEGDDRRRFLARNGWVRKARAEDPVPLVTTGGRRNPAGATITLAMIARDEEEMLPACLESARELVDEIVVVDTGSTDRTEEVARAHGATVLRHSWDDDFAAARNVGLAAATSEWVLVLDADERLTADAVMRIRDAVRSETVGAYMLPLVNEGPDDEDDAGVFLLRLFRSRPSIRFCYRIHEQVAGSVMRYARRNGLAFERLPGATIRHLGYRADVVASRGKIERNQRHFEAQLELHPNDVYSWYKYADFLREAGSVEPARAAARRAYSILADLPIEEVALLPYAGEVIALHVLDRVASGAAEEAWRASRLVHGLRNGSPHAWYARGTAALAVEEWEEALDAFDRCRASHGAVIAVPVDAGLTGAGSEVGRGQALLRLGRRADARRAFADALHHDPRSFAAVGGLLELEDGDVDAALAVVRGRFDGAHDVALRLTGAQALVLSGRPERAARWLVESGSVDAPDVASALGEAYLHAGEFARALDAWSSSPGHVSCRAGVILASALVDDPPPSAPNADEMESVKSYLANLRRAGRSELFETAARACVRAGLVGSGRGTT